MTPFAFKLWQREMRKYGWFLKDEGFAASLTHTNGNGIYIEPKADETIFHYCKQAILRHGRCV